MRRDERVRMLHCINRCRIEMLISLRFGGVILRGGIDAMEYRIAQERM